MKYIKDSQEEKAAQWMDKAKEVAQKATCKRAKCGAIIMRDDRIIGRGFNSPPGESEKERRCEVEKNTYNQKVTDKTCCVHAEQRAVMDALAQHPDKVKGAQLYFIGFYPNGELRLDKGEIRLYCTICTKMMFDVGIAEFIINFKP